MEGLNLNSTQIGISGIPDAERIKKLEQRVRELETACAEAQCFFNIKVPANIPNGFWVKFDAAQTRAIKALDAAMRKET